MVITHKIPVDIPNSSVHSILSHQEQHNTVKQLRKDLLLHYRPILQHSMSPIRVMARMVAELEKQCRELNIAEEVIQAEIVNRTIGDVNLRMITECVGESGGSGDFRLLADELGVALPGEQLCGYVASGETYLWLREKMHFRCLRKRASQVYPVLDSVIVMITFGYQLVLFLFLDKLCISHSHHKILLSTLIEM